MHSSKSTVFPLPVGAEITIFISDRKQAGKHSLCSELKYLHVETTVFETVPTSWGY